MEEMFAFLAVDVFCALYRFISRGLAKLTYLLQLPPRLSYHRLQLLWVRLSIQELTSLSLFCTAIENQQIVPNLFVANGSSRKAISV